MTSEGATPLEEKKKEEDNGGESVDPKEESVETIIETPEADIKIEEEITEEKTLQKMKKMLKLQRF